MHGRLALFLLPLALFALCACAHHKPTTDKDEENALRSEAMAFANEGDKSKPAKAAKPATAQTGQPRDSLGARAPSLFWPLNLGNTWTYSRRFLGETGSLTVSIAKRGEDDSYVDSTGSKLWVTPFGVRDATRYLLRSPLEKGEHWRAQTGPETTEFFEVIEDDAQITVPAGHFEHCLIVRSTTRLPAGARMLNVAAYAPQVGLVRNETLVENNQKRQASQVLLELVSYQIP